MKKVLLKDINFNNLTIKVDKYNYCIAPESPTSGAVPCTQRDAVCHGRKVYYDEFNKIYIKIFNPSYCLLDNFKKGINSGFLKDLAPALISLIYDNNQLIGYICEEGTLLPYSNVNYYTDKDTPSTENPFSHRYKYVKTKETESWLPTFFLKKLLKNCKKYNKFYFDISPHNIVKLNNGQYSLIDLEGIYDYNDEGKEKVKKDGFLYKPSNLFELIDNYK